MGDDERYFEFPGFLQNSIYILELLYQAYMFISLFVSL
jgi:hypothetical protein